MPSACAKLFGTLRYHVRKEISVQILTALWKPGFGRLNTEFSHQMTLCTVGSGGFADPRKIVVQIDGLGSAFPDAIEETFEEGVFMVELLQPVYFDESRYMSHVEKTRIEFKVLASK